MEKTGLKKLFDKTGSAFVLDHEHDGTAYVRPLVKVFYQSSYGKDVSEEEDFEPAPYLVAVNRSSLFDNPPIAEISEEVSAKQRELKDLKIEAEKTISDIRRQQSIAERDLANAKYKLEQWMKGHRVMMDLGKLLDGLVLYPLSVRENNYHKSRDIPRVPTMHNLSLLSLTSGNFEKGQKWTIKQYGSDCYGHPFQFFDTAEERFSVILSEFELVCESFRKSPNFETTSYITGTTLHYGTLLEWVKTHPDLNIPDDIKAMKVANDAEVIERKKAALSAQLAALSKVEG